MTRIAIIDDNEPTQTLLHDAFDEKGWESVPFTTGRGAVDNLKHVHPDLVVLDLWLDPPLTGWDILEEMAGDPATSAIPVILCSWDAASLRRDEDETDDRVVAYLVKPFDIEHHYRCVDFALSRLKSHT